MKIYLLNHFVYTYICIHQTMHLLILVISRYKLNSSDKVHVQFLALLIRWPTKWPQENSTAHRVSDYFCFWPGMYFFLPFSSKVFVASSCKTYTADCFHYSWRRKQQQQLLTFPRSTQYEAKKCGTTNKNCAGGRHAVQTFLYIFPLGAREAQAPSRRNI